MSAPSGPPPKKMKKAESEGAVPDDDALKATYEALETLQEKIEQLNEQASEEIIAVERKYNEKRKPFYRDRSTILKQIPRFWKQTFLNHDVLVDCLSEEDQSVFEYLEDLNVEDLDNGGFRITFRFKPNQWFKNSVLFKEFSLSEDGQYTIKASKIEWKEGKDLTKPDNEEDSFFSIWFDTSSDEGTPMPDDVAEIIKEEIWPNPSKFYHGLMTPEEAEEESAEGEDDDEDDDEKDQ